MPKLDDKHIAVARVYNRAVLDLAKDQSGDVIDELLEIAGLMERDESFTRFLSSPLVDTEERAKSLETLFRGKASDLVVDTLQILNLKGRLEILPTMTELCRREHLDASGHLEVEVTSAVALDEATRDKLRKTLLASTGKKQADLIEAVDPDLLGGLVVRVGDHKYDGSVRREIEKLKARIHERALHDIYESHQTHIA